MRNEIRSTWWLLALCIGLLGGFAGTGHAGLDYPHFTIAGSSSCTYCHFPFGHYPDLIPEQYQQPPLDVDDTPANRLCLGCHTGIQATLVTNHSSLTTDNGYGDWTLECRTCHNPHSQDQFRVYGPEAYLDSGPCTTVAAGSLVSSGKSWLPDAFGGKVLVPNVAEPDHNYEILGNTADTLTVDGPIDLSKAGVGDTFAIIKGGLVRAEIETPNSGTQTVKLYRDTGMGSFADGQGARDGICEVCHTQTTHFRNDGGGTEPTHENISAGGVAGDRCVRCHSHTNGFRHGTGASGTGCEACHGNDGAHVPHTGGMGLTCDRCHDTNDFPGFTSGTDSNGDGHIGLSETDVCSACHQDGRGGAPNHADFKDNWPTPGYDLQCDGCHKGRAGIDTDVMDTDGHARLVGEQWIRKYPCYYCHDDTVDPSWNLLGAHANGTVDVVVDQKWHLDGQPAPTFDAQTKVCSNVYCHSDGTRVNPVVHDIAWTDPRHLECNDCHGHPLTGCDACHSDGRSWGPTEEWKSAMPMYANQGPGSSKPNSHPRHTLTDFSCENCHNLTVVGDCKSCHISDPTGSMGEVAHVDPTKHVNGNPDVDFLDANASYDYNEQKCSTTPCHLATVPQWGDSVRGQVICLGCHGTSEPDVNDYAAFNGTRGRINLTEWATTGHGRPAASGNYTSGNPPADLPGTPCWYCHDPDVLHNTPGNPFRLKLHPEYAKHFERECMYCHQQGLDPECMGCHNTGDSIAPQLSTITTPQDHTTYVDGLTSCVTVCHPDDASRHKMDAGAWTAVQMDDVKNTYQMMGVCLKCHDENQNNRCTQCHAGAQYTPGYDSGDGMVTATARASMLHFGYRHKEAHDLDGVWKGGKFCWDCHDPHGDTNAYMIHDDVSLETDGTFGIPTVTGQVEFTNVQSGLGYAKSDGDFSKGLCNVCHTKNSHYTQTLGDGHNAGRVCTTCHEHRWGDSHASGQTCDTCHLPRPVVRHDGMGLPRDCTKCHSGVINKRMNIMGQFSANSHHVQGVPVTNLQCYACHWEATSAGLIDVDYHGGYNNKTHTSTPNDKVDLVIWEPGQRPTIYQPGVTATEFWANKIGTAEERAQVGEVTKVCLGCHSDQNRDTEPFNDCNTPRQYAWDRTSIGDRYSDTGTTTWGKYPGAPGAAVKSVTKAYSAHGNAVANEGGFDPVTGLDGAIPNTRNGTQNIQCFDCHSSHGSKAAGITSSYVTFNGTRNGANLKETQAGKGGYGVTYFAQAIPDGPSPVNTGAAQCLDCHETPDGPASGLPWGYNTTFGADEPIRGYRDSPRFGDGPKGLTAVYPYTANKPPAGGHFSPSSPLTSTPNHAIDGLCTPCHDPHGVTPTLGALRPYGVPMLKGTWLTSPYKEDHAAPVPYAADSQTTGTFDPTWTWSKSWGYGPDSPIEVGYNVDRIVFGNDTDRITETPDAFAGLCLGCHAKGDLTDELENNQDWRTTDRIHEAVAGWGDNSEHSYPCSKCHQPHSSGLPRLLQTDCLDYNHRGEQVSGGQPARTDTANVQSHGRGQHRGYPEGDTWGNSHENDAAGACHMRAPRQSSETWPDGNKWNELSWW